MSSQLFARLGGRAASGDRARSKASWQSWLLRSAGAGVVAWGLLETVVTGVQEPATAAAFGALVVAGELVRITYPAGRVQTPLAWAGGLAYALRCSLTGESGSHRIGQAVAVVALGMAIGALPHAVAGRELGVDSMARRVLGVAAAAAIYCQLLVAHDAEGAWQGDIRLEALVMLIVVAVVVAIDWALRAALAFGRTSGSLWRHFITEVGVAPGIDASVIATAVTLAIATSITGLWAIPLFSIPLLLTQSSYRHFNAARATYAQTINALSKATELAGFTVVGHARRVADLAVELGAVLGVGPHHLTDLEYAALLHDLGQMTLTQPLPGGATVGLPPDERRQLAAAGAALIEEARIPGRVAQIVGRQAEPFGRGPNGSAVPLGSRIIAVTNAYDDLTRGQSGVERSRQALERIDRAAGADFDPRVVAALRRQVAQAEGGVSASSSRVATGG